MRRSNRLVVLVGLFLAVVAFVGVFLILQTPGTGPSNPTQVDEVVAATDIPLGTTITADMVKTVKVNTIDLPVNAYKQTALVIGQTARKELKAGQIVLTDVFVTSAVNIQCPPGLRCMSVQVDQVTGVGTLIQSGDFVDMVVGFTADKFPVVTVNRTGATTGGTAGTTTITPVTGLNATSVKLLLQGMQVMGTLLPTPTTTQPQQGGASPAPNQPVLNGQQEIVIVAVPAQYAEVIKFAQMDGNVTLLLRSSKDCVIPGQSPSPEPSAAPSPTPGSACSIVPTTGAILKTLVDKYGVLVPQVVQAILPSAAP